MSKRKRGGGIVAERDGMRVELMPDDEEDDGHMVEPVSLGTLNREFGATHEPCWACEYNFGPPDDPDANEAMHELWTFWTTGRFTMAKCKFAEQMATMHEEVMRGPLIKQGIPCIEWPADIVERHMGNHTLDPEYELVANVKKIRDIQMALEDSLFDQVDCRSSSRPQAGPHYRAAHTNSSRQDKVTGTVAPKRNANLNTLKVYLLAWEKTQAALRGLVNTH